MHFVMLTNILYVGWTFVNVLCDYNSQEPVENWPLCDCLISFHSKGFPLEKAVMYTELRRPFVINDLYMQYKLQNRFVVWRLLINWCIVIDNSVFFASCWLGIRKSIGLVSYYNSATTVTYFTTFGGEVPQMRIGC